PGYNGGILLFGYDWFGRQYGLIRHVDNVLVMFDPSMIESFELAGDLVEFHNTDLVSDKEETVSAEAFSIASYELGITDLRNDQCVGYKVPLFLGGKDEYSNYEIIDMEVYWEIQYQLFMQVK